ncbi:probable multidrug resistance-associated protein lethal(2)03659 [Sitodiplosis mosellana]|uniref:probable multidrug resistance-associated protein lethal(2)03659 n=1 Tax=Sitodiplosis mosellana TaxID=263140 RepID=UPI002444FD80|nr:probable multidrug resistance-associated protein lethal(2)03659 [Sitodiplosis mosellana]XP_055302414.1 probable multidrug resistance-associated protein lethal(2)03659 [Sitodiplosis mosellana]
MNVANEKTENIEHPYEKATILARWTFWWLKDLFKLGLRKSLDACDIYDNLKENDSAGLKVDFEDKWEKEKKREKRKPRILNVIWRISLSKTLGFSVLYSLIDILLRVVQSQCIGGLVLYFSKSGTESHTSVHWYAFGLISCAFLSSSITNPFLMYTYQRGLHIRIALCSMVYSKVLKMRKSSALNGSSGKVINLLSFDTYRFDTAVSLLHHLWKGPIEVLIFGYILYNELDYYGWIGVAFIMCFIPIQITMGKMIAKFRYRVIKQTDARIRTLNEILQGIQTIKIFAWERPFINMVQKIRKKELQSIRGVFIVRGVLCSFSIISRLAIFLTLASYVCFGNVFTPRQVFVVTSCYNFLYDSMLYFWTVSVTSLAECFVSMKRIENFLLLPEGKPLKSEKINFAFSSDDSLEKHSNVMISSHKIVQVNEHSQAKCVIFKNITAKWSAENQSGIIDMDFEIHDKQMIAISGPVAASKSTILLVMLRELEIDSGELIVNGLISYSPQEPWVFDATIRQNILFNEPFDSERYLEVIRVCSLERDLQSLPAGDLTMVGESGICLSGGQKSRINLARAIYRRADIYLLDDPLSAVDTAVGKYIFNNCIKDFLRDKICILVTHQEQYISASNRTIFIQNGKCQKITQNKPFNQTDINAESKKYLNKVQISHDLNAAHTEQVKSRQEHQSIGSISGNVYKSYVESVESPILITVVIGLFVIGQMLISGIDFVVSKWVNWEIDLATHDYVISMKIANITSKDTGSIKAHRIKFLYLYALLIIAALYLVFQRAFTLYIFCLRAARRIHDRLLQSVLHASMYFFNINSSGRIINRFCKDLYDVDYYLALVLYDVTLLCLQSIMSLVLVSLTNTWVAVATLGMSFVFYGMRHMYVSSARCLRRLEALGRSAIISHTNATINGLCTIHATKSEAVLLKEFNSLQNHNTSVGYIFKASTRAIAFWLELLCVLYMTVAIVIFLVLDKEITGGNVGLAITQILSLISLSQWGVRQTAELENNMTSVERIMEYINLQPEEDKAHDDSISKPPENWPANGVIEFINVSLKYTEKGDRILNSVNFKVHAGEKVTICGRTGAGKTSIVKALFRMAYNEGLIKIDSVDISTVPLNTLRSSLSIIPQDATLFSGTIRENLDPFNEHSDDDLWRALDQVELKSIIRVLPNGLDDDALSGGRNLSAGQRSLFCLARAILRKNKILILDEATANLDIAMDYLLQKTIRKHFSHCTVLTIAHRLHTIIADSSRILVMDAGKVVEFDHAHRLLQNSDGFLTKLVNETGPTDAQYLKEIAQLSYEKKSNGICEIRRR